MGCLLAGVSEDVANSGGSAMIIQYSMIYTAIGHTPALAGGAREMHFFTGGNAHFVSVDIMSYTLRRCPSLFSS
jgi:hypothetical protein